MEATLPVRARTTSLEGRTALVLGAAGELGIAAARTLAGLGARVVVADDDHTALQREYGGDDRFEAIARTTSAAELAALAVSLPDLDVLIRPGRCDDGCGSGDAEPGLGAIRFFVPAMARRRRGSIIAVACPPRRDRDAAAAASASSDLHQAVRGLAGELRPFGVRVNAVASDRAGSAAAVAFLASDTSAHVTGAVLAMEQGWSALTSIDVAPSAIGMLRPVGDPPAGRVPTLHAGRAAAGRAYGFGSMMDEGVYERRRA